MKPIEAKNQVRLGPARCVQLALSGMSYRMFRSMITISILALAVAFLVHMLVYGLVSHETQTAAYHELQQSRQMAQIITRLTRPDSMRVVLDQLADDDDDVLAEYRAWSGVDGPTFDDARQAAQQVRDFDRYLGQLPEAGRAAVVGDRSTAELLERLRDPEAMADFTQTVENLAVAPPLGGYDRLTELVNERRPIMIEAARQIRQGHREAIRQVRAAYDNRAARALAAAPPAGFGQSLRDAGFAFDDGVLPGLEAFADRADDLATLARLVVTPEIRKAVARQTDVAPADVSLEQTLLYVDNDRRARWFSQTLIDGGADPRFTPERVLDLSEQFARERQLQAAAGPEAPTGEGGILGLPTRTKWLIALSFLVCVVGVANAMLMSVTERFTEIATMKCLGAMDIFVMMMFVVEAMIQGIIGGIIGIVLGVLLAGLRGGVEYGGLLANAGDALADVGIAIVLSLIVGMLLATVAAVGPSFVAARLAPMEAMRVD